MNNPKSLKGKMMIGLFWSFTDLMANHGIQFMIQIILARILLPEHFGIIGMIIVFIAISESIVDSGFTQALIRDQQTSQADYSTIFYFNVFIAVVLYCMLFVTAPIISRFFEEPQLINIIRVLSFVLIINSLGIIQKVILVKNIDFKTITKVSVIAVITSGSVTITLAMLGYGVWSLVVNILIMQLVQTVFFWFFNKWIPSLTFNVHSFRKFFGFGNKLLISGLIDTFYNNLYFLIIGRLYSTTQLGFYTNAIKVRDLASQSIAAALQRVSYPILSSIQDDEGRLRSSFRKIIKMSAFINFPLLVGLAAIATPLFSLLLGEKWMPSVIYFQLLCLAGMLYPLHAINLNILQVKGRSDLFLLIEVIKKSVLTILIILSLVFKLGIIGLICSAVLNSYISLFINTYFSAKEIAYSAKNQLKDLFPAYSISLIMGGSVYLVGDILPVGNFLLLVCQITFGFFIYILLCKLAKIQELDTVYQMIYAKFPLRMRLKKA